MTGRGVARAMPAVVACLLFGACATVSDPLRDGEPAMRAVFPTPSEAATDCLDAAWRSVRVRGIDGPLRVTTGVVVGKGTIEIGLPRAEKVAWRIEVVRSADGATAAAWSRPTAPPDLSPTFAEVFRQSVSACRGEVTDDRFERTSRRRLADGR